MVKKYVCPYCGCVLENQPHKISGHLSKTCIKYEEFKKSLINNLTYDFLYEQYVINEKSASHIAKDLGFLKPNYIIDFLKKYNIPMRDRKQNRIAKGYIELTKRTCLGKYGVEYHTMKNSPVRDRIYEGFRMKHNTLNPFKDDIVLSKIKKTIQERYGVKYISQNQDIKDKVKKTCLRHYGVDNVSKNQDIINKIKVSKASKKYVYAFSSKKANLFFQMLYDKLKRKEHIYFSSLNREFCIMSDRHLYSYDFVDTENKKCIEYNGDYWHANPLVYSYGWVNPHNGLTCADIKKMDEIKYDAIRSKGYDVMVIWERECDQNTQDMIDKCLMFLLV